MCIFLKKKKSLLSNDGWRRKEILRRTYGRCRRGWSKEPFLFLRHCFGSTYSFSTMVGHLFQNYDTIYVRFFPTYTCNHSCYTIYVRFLSRILAFYSQVYDHFLTNAHIYAHKKTHIYALQTSMWYMRSQKVVV